MEEKKKPLYDCSRCTGYCCSYDRIALQRRDVIRIARHFGITPDQAADRYTKVREGERVLRHQKDHIFKTVCMFLDRETRRCTIYDARPPVCREYPEKRRCGYYEFLRWERRHQDDKDFIPLER